MLAAGRRRREVSRLKLLVRPVNPTLHLRKTDGWNSDANLRRGQLYFVCN